MKTDLERIAQEADDVAESRRQKAPPLDYLSPKKLAEIANARRGKKEAPAWAIVICILLICALGAWLLWIVNNLLSGEEKGAILLVAAGAVLLIGIIAAGVFVGMKAAKR